MSKDGALETLFYPLDTGGIDSKILGRPLFLNAQMHSMLGQIRPICYQVFKPYAAQLLQAGFDCVQDIPEQEEYDSVFILCPKNQIEAEGLIAAGLERLRARGLLVIAANNKAGGARLPKILKKFGLEGALSESKNKARVMWAEVDQSALDALNIRAAIAASVPQEILGGEFVSQAGIYGWDKIDKGSAFLLDILRREVPEGFKGNIADFGCGYGYLSRPLSGMPKVKSLHCIDADARALAMCRQNLNGVEGAVFDWQDLTACPYKARFDVVLMNPPFHEGKSADSGIGRDFIVSAHAALRPRGTLWMVANTHLPYEAALSEMFFKYKEVAHASGFKVFRAEK